MRFLTLILALLFLPLASERAMGEEWNKNEIRVITPTEATSKCIGDPRTPICAMETLMACFIRKTRSLCEAVGINDVASHIFEEEPSSTTYKIVSVKTIRQKDIPKRLLNVEWIKKGDVDIEILDIGMKLAWCLDGCHTSFMLRKVGDNWIVTAHAVEGVD